MASWVSCPVSGRDSPLSDAQPFDMFISAILGPDHPTQARHQAIKKARTAAPQAACGGRPRATHPRVFASYGMGNPGRPLNQAWAPPTEIDRELMTLSINLQSAERTKDAPWFSVVSGGRWLLSLIGAHRGVSLSTRAPPSQASRRSSRSGSPSASMWILLNLAKVGLIRAMWA